MKKIVFIFCLLLLFLVFKRWFNASLLSGGDWVYYSPQAIHDSHILSSWDDRNVGMGMNEVIRLPLDLYFTTTMKVSPIIGWILYERIFWFWPYITISFLSGYILYNKLFQGQVYAIFAGFLYAANSYALMIVGGGQMGVSLAYAFAPFVLAAFIYVLENLSLFSSVVFGVFYSFLMFLDIRVVYVYTLMLGLFSLFSVRFIARNRKIFPLIFLSGTTVFCLLAFWFFPTIFSRGISLSQFSAAYTSSDSLAFFSFAKLEYAIALLHPNWPENIFGKVAFLRPEFLIYPLFAFSALLFIPKNKQYKKYILFLSTCSLIGIFLAKGSTEPFGSIYIWMFNHIPGFIMFRDPTKWYMLIALSYALLIPFVAENIYLFLRGKVKNIVYVIIVICTIFLLFPLRDAFLGKLSGTLSEHSMPVDYKHLSKMLQEDSQFSRTLWIPQIQRFGSFSQIHPAESGEDFYNVASISGVLYKLSEKNAEQQLQDSAIRYVIIPYDSEGELFLADRKYSGKEYNKVLAAIRKLSWLKEQTGFGRIYVFVVNNSLDHFWLLTSRRSISYIENSPTNFSLHINNGIKGERLIFSENFDQQWELLINQEKFSSVKYNNLNSFTIPKDGSYNIRIVYRPQWWVMLGFTVSCLTGLLIAIYFVNKIFRFYNEKKS